MAVYEAALGTASYTVVLIPTVTSELDDLKDRGRTPEVRDAATRALRRIKGLEDRGDLRTGIPVANRVYLRAEHREVRSDETLNWLDPDVPDDRTLASALKLLAPSPAATVVLITRDLNLQTNAVAVARPFVENPVTPKAGGRKTAPCADPEF